MAKTSEPPAPTTIPAPLPARDTKAVLPPPPGPRTDHQTPWEKQAEAYLLSRGWQKILHSDGVHASWYDSHVHEMKPYLKHTQTLEGRDGTSEVLMQWHAPNIPWGHSLEDAVDIQTERDQTPEGLQLQIEHKRKELAALEEMATRPAGQ